MYKSTLVCPECNFTCVKFDTMVRAPPTLQCLQQVPVHDFVRLWDRSGQDHDRLQLWGCATSSCNRRRSSAWQLWGATEAQAAQHGPRFQPLAMLCPPCADVGVPGAAPDAHAVRGICGRPGRRLGGAQEARTGGALGRHRRRHLCQAGPGAVRAKRTQLAAFEMRSVFSTACKNVRGVIVIGGDENAN